MQKSARAAMAATPATVEAVGDSAVTRSHGQILDMILSFELKPGERINETEIARRLGVSRTPLREALNRLVSEGFLFSRPAKGFFCRPISAEEIFQLCQLRTAVETAAIKLAVERATEEMIDELEALLKDSREAAGASWKEQLDIDEAFHERLMAISGNQEMLSVLRSVNRKIRSVRWIGLTRTTREATHQQHTDILDAFRRRDAQACIGALEGHIGQRMDQIEASIREVYGNIYAGPGGFAAA